MYKYSFTVRSRGFEISLVTDDRDSIEQQIAIWVMALSRNSLYNNANAISDNFITQEPNSKSLKKNGVFDKEVLPLEQKNVRESNYKSIDDITDSVPNNLNNNKKSEQQKESNDTECSYENMRGSKKEVSEEFAAFAPAGTETSSDNADSMVEKFINTMDENLINNNETARDEKLFAKESAVTLNSLVDAEKPTSVDFETILEKSVDNLDNTANNLTKKDEIFCKLVKANNITDRLELLLFTADYFCKYDAKFVFSLKQINGKLMHNLAVIVDHGILKIALDNNYLERAGESEYRLTEYGRSEIYSKAGIWS